MNRFLTSTTCHGFQHIANAKSIWLKLLWFCLLGQQLISLLSSFFSQQQKWTTTIYEIPNSSLDFPSVTICNFNRIKLSKAKQYNMTMDLVSFYLRQATGPYFAIYYVNDEEIQNFTVWRDTHNFTSLSILNDLGPTCEDTFLIPINPCNKTWGYFDNITPVFSPEMGRCFQIQASNISSGFAGQMEARQLLLDPQLYEYLPVYWNNFHDAGFSMQLTYEKERVLLGDWFNLSPGMHSWVAIRRIQAINKYKSKLFTLYPSPCIEKSEATLNVVQDIHYSNKWCQFDCYTLEQTNVCGCVPMILPDLKPGFRICNSEEFLNCPLMNVALNHSCRSKCKYLCERTEIEATVTSTPFPATEAQADLYKRFLKRPPGKTKLSNQIIYFQK